HASVVTVRAAQSLLSVRARPSFPPRRSSELHLHDEPVAVGGHEGRGAHGGEEEAGGLAEDLEAVEEARAEACEHARREPPRRPPDRKSTRLNSSHLGISYAVFCLKKKKKKKR